MIKYSISAREESISNSLGQIIGILHKLIKDASRYLNIIMEFCLFTFCEKNLRAKTVKNEKRETLRMFSFRIRQMLTGIRNVSSWDHFNKTNPQRPS